MPGNQDILFPTVPTRSPQTNSYSSFNSNNSNNNGNNNSNVPQAYMTFQNSNSTNQSYYSNSSNQTPPLGSYQSNQVPQMGSYQSFNSGYGGYNNFPNQVNFSNQQGNSHYPNNQNYSYASQNSNTTSYAPLYATFNQNHSNTSHYPQNSGHNSNSNHNQAYNTVNNNNSNSYASLISQNNTTPPYGSQENVTPPYRSYDNYNSQNQVNSPYQQSNSNSHYSNNQNPSSGSQNTNPEPYSPSYASFNQNTNNPNFQMKFPQTQPPKAPQPVLNYVEPNNAQSFQNNSSYYTNNTESPKTITQQEESNKINENKDEKINEESDYILCNESLRKSLGTKIRVKTNDDGSVEGWLWQQQNFNTWERIYVIIDNDKLYGFEKCPEDNDRPKQGLSLEPGMIVTPNLPINYKTKCGFAFTIQLKPKSTDVVVFDTYSDGDRQIWVSALLTGTKRTEAEVWIPWDINSNTKKIELAQEIRLKKQDEEEKLHNQFNEKIEIKITDFTNNQVDEIKRNNSDLGNSIEDLRETELEINSLRKSANILAEQTNEIRDEIKCSNSMEDIEKFNQSIFEKEKELQIIEQMIQEKQNKLSSLENEEVKKFQQMVKEKENSIRNEYKNQFEREKQELLLKIESEFQDTKKAQSEKLKEEELVQVKQWLADNPSWAAYYKNLDVTLADLTPNNLVLLKKLIKLTANYCLSGNNRAVDTSNTDNDTIDDSSTPISVPVPLTNNNNNLIPKTSDFQDSEEIITAVLKKQEDFSNLVPSRPAPLPPSEEDELEEFGLSTSSPSVPSYPAPIPLDSNEYLANESKNENEYSDQFAIPESVPPPPPPPLEESEGIDLRGQEINDRIHANLEENESKNENEYSDQFAIPLSVPPPPPPPLEESEEIYQREQEYRDEIHVNLEENESKKENETSEQVIVPPSVLPPPPPPSRTPSTLNIPKPPSTRPQTAQVERVCKLFGIFYVTINKCFSVANTQFAIRNFRCLKRF